MRNIILFKSDAVTIKSIYRKKLKNRKYVVYLRFSEKTERYSVKTDDVEDFKGMKKGELVTIHVGNGSYFAIEKGNNVSQDGSVRYCEIPNFTRRKYRH